MSGALLAAATKPAFARHETFHLRFGWLRKAYVEAQADPYGAVFSQDDATVRLGVGKNMVSAIRYWAQAYKILEEQENKERPRMPLLVPTAFGHALLAEDGWDPYLEDVGSLWLLHWKLLEPPCLAPVWWVAFNLFAQQQFEERHLTDHVVELTSAAGWPAVKESSIKKDVDCLLRTFALRRYGRQTMDDLLDCPTRELGLITPTPGDARSWRFVVGSKSSLPNAILAFASFEYMARAGAGSRTMSLARLTGDPGSPGRVFGLTESAMYDALSAAQQRIPGMRVAEPAGLRQLVVEGDPGLLANGALSAYFGARRSVA
ncbi:DUF4007 family protein [Geodermatophilus sp. SYSU D01106]